jgi:hypothetical protein
VGDFDYSTARRESAQLGVDIAAVETAVPAATALQPAFEYSRASIAMTVRFLPADDLFQRHTSVACQCGILEALPDKFEFQSALPV